MHTVAVIVANRSRLSGKARESRAGFIAKIVKQLRS